MTKPYYQDKWVTIYRKSCEDMSEVEDGSVQVVFADPPFNVGKHYGGNRDNREDYYPWCAQWIKDCFLRLGNDGSIHLMTIPRHKEDYTEE